MTGGAGAGDIAAAQTEPYPFPPVTLESPPYAASLLPSYTSTGSISTLPPPTYTNTKGASINAGNGWFDAQDTLAAPTPIAGCAYPNAWDAVSATLPPAVVCGGAAAGGVIPVTTATTATTATTPVAVIPTVTTTTAVAIPTRTTAAVRTTTVV